MDKYTLINVKVHWDEWCNIFAYNKFSAEAVRKQVALYTL